MSTIIRHILPNEMCRRTGFSCKFRTPNEFTIFPSQSLKPNDDDSIPYNPTTPAKLYTLRPEVIIFHPILRRLLNEASVIFVQQQNALRTQYSSEDILQFSIQYRSVIRACLENLKEEVMRIEGAEKTLLQNYVTIFYSIECVWHLCEILYLQNSVGNTIGTKLLEWVRFHIPKHERNATHMLQEEGATSIETREDYWPTVIGCLLHGRVYEVRLLLGMHSNASTKPFRAAEAALKAMPTHDLLAGGMALTDFNIRRKHWLVDTQAKIEAQTFLGEELISFIMRLVVGEEVAWNDVRQHCEAWYELLAAWLFYTDPTLKIFELKRFARKCMWRMGVTMKHIDVILLAAMETDVEFLKQIQTVNDNGWFITHLVDLLYHARQLDAWKSNEVSSIQLRESFIVEYATLLMDHHSLWQIGLSYLDHCPRQGLAMMEFFLPRVARSELKVKKVINEALKRRLFRVVQSVSKVQFRRNVQMNRLGNALLWAIKSKDAESITYLVNRFLRQYKASYVLPNEDLLSNLGACMFDSDSLIFLGKYYDYRQLMSRREFSKAAQLLVGLIGSRFTPKFFWDVILTETLTLLESTEMMIDGKSSVIIMNYLDDRADQLELQDKIAMIRMALARNMANVLAQPRQTRQILY